MKHLDPDQIGTEATRCLLDVRTDRPSGYYVVHADETVLLELESDDLAHRPDPVEGGHEAYLTDQGMVMLQLIGVNT